MDNEYQDVYVLGEDTKISRCVGKVVAVIERKNDLEDKLIVVTNNKEFTVEEIKQIVDFQEKYFKSKIVK